MHLKIQASVFLVDGSKIKFFVENAEPFFQHPLLYAIALINPLPSACSHVTDLRLSSFPYVIDIQRISIALLNFY